MKFLPVYKDIIDDPTFKSMKVYDAWKTTLQGRQAPTYYIPPAHEILSIIGQATLDTMYGKVEPKTVLDKIAPPRPCWLNVKIPMVTKPMCATDE